MGISVVIPCYNSEKYLEQCLETLLAQTMQDLEFIFVDDGSKDNTAQILDSFLERDPRIKVIHQPNKGLGGARNTGMAAAQGEFLGFLDADDTLSPNFYEALYDAALRHNADIAWANLLRCSKGKVPHYVVHFTEEKVLEGFEGRLIRRSHHVPIKIYRRKLFDDKSLWFKEGVFYEDIMFTPPVMAAANKVVTVPSAVYYYASDASSITRRKQDTKLQYDRWQALLFVRNFLLAGGLPVPGYLKQIRKKDYGIGRFSVIKIKDCGRYDVVKLFDVLPLWRIKH